MKQERVGELYILGEAALWGLFPVITILSYKVLPSMISLTLSTFLSGIFFFLITLYRKKLYELRNPLLWKYVLYIVFFIGILFYSFYYFGLTKTTSGNASILSLFEVCTSYIFFNLIRKEHFSFESKIGTVLMVLGATIVLLPNFSSINFGDLFILIATFCAPIGNFFSQKVKQIASTETILFLRSLIATPLLLLLAYMFGQHLHVAEIKESFWFIFINGILLFGVTKIFWLEGITRISVTKANALGSITPLFTLFIAWIVFIQVPTIWQITSLVPFFFGVLLLTNNLKLFRSVQSI